MTTTTRTKACAGPACDRRVYSRGLCRTHDQQRRKGRTLTPIPIPTIDLVLDAAWCIGGTVTVAELSDRTGIAHNTISRAIQRNPDLIEWAGTIPVKHTGEPQSREVATWRITPAGLDRLHG